MATTKKARNQQQVSVEIQKDMGWLKSLLNNMPLLKWVKHFSADHLFEDNEMAKKFEVQTNEDSISIADKTITKILVTHSKYGGEVHARYSMKQLAQVITLLGSGGELLISKTNNHEMFVQMGDTVVIVCPLPKEDEESDY